MNRFKNIKNGVLMGLVNNILSIILPFISRTIIIRQLGVEYVGLGSLFTSLLQVLSLSELGFAAAISYMLYEPLAAKNTEKVNAILNLLRKINIVIGLVILVLSIFLYPFLDNLVSSDVPNGISIHLLFIVFVINTVISYFFYAYKSILLSAGQRYDVAVSISSLILVIQSVSQIAVLLFLKSYYCYVIVYPIMTLLSNILSALAVNKYFPGYKCRGKLEKEELSLILKNTAGAFISKIGSTIYNSVDSIVISSFLGLLVLGRYNNYYYVVLMLTSAFAVFHNSARPVIGNIIVVEKKEYTWSIFRDINCLYIIVSGICASCCTVLYQDFERTWQGVDNILPFGLVIFFVVYFFVGRLGAPLDIFRESAGLLWKAKFVYLISAGVNLVSNLILVRYCGLYGILLSSIIATIMISYPGVLYVVFTELFDKNCFKVYVKDTIFLLLQTVFVIVIIYFLLRNIYVTNWLLLLVKAFISLIVSAVLFLAINAYNRDFRRMVKTLFRRIIKRNKKS